MIPSQPLIEAENCSQSLEQPRYSKTGGLFQSVFWFRNRDRDDFAAQNVERRLQPCNILVASRRSV